MIVDWEALHMKKNYDDEQENTTAYRVRLLRQDRGWSQKELADKIKQCKKVEITLRF